MRRTSRWITNGLMVGILVVFVWSGMGGMAFSKDDDAHITGLPELTQEELDWQNTHMIRTQKVKLNRVGLERVNAHRKKQGHGQLTEKDVPVVPIGKEIEGVIGAPDAAVPDSDSTDAALPMVLPASVDNSTLKYFPPIRSQGSLPSCGVFSGTYYAMTHMHALARNLDAKTGGDAYRFSPKWTYNMVNGGEQVGSWYYWAYDIGKKHGVATWAEFPYDSDYRSWCMNATAWRNAIDKRFDQYGYVDNTNQDTGIDQVKQLLNNGYVLNIPTYISSWQYKTIGNDPSTSEDDAYVGKQICYWVNGTAGYHGMTVVGYNDTIWVDINGNGAVDAGEKGAFRIANSWGTGWGESGFVWMAYDALKNPSAVVGGPSTSRINGWSPSRAHWVTARSSYTPTLVAQFTLNHLRRNQIRMNLGVSRTTDAAPNVSWLPNMIYGQGGAYAFNGTTTACDGTFYLDFSDIVPSGGDYMRYYLGIYDTATGDSVALSNYRIIDTVNGNAAIVCENVPVVGDNQQLYRFVEYNFNDGNLPPVAQATGTPLSGTAPLTVFFSSTGSSDPDGSIVSYDWDFGDGTSATGATVTHTYLSAGNYGVTLTVTDNKTSTNEAWLTVQVTPDPNKVLHVEGISFTQRKVSKSFLVDAKVTIKDIFGKPVANATVNGSWSGLVRGNVVGITNASGEVVLTSPKTSKTGLVTFKVISVSATGFTYDSSNSNISSSYTIK
jgi:PKD repeat protein/C1A family cysteine protease